MTTTTKRTPSNIIRSIPLSSIRPDPGQPRKSFDDAALRELANSIAENGLLQPISVRQLTQRTPTAFLSSPASAATAPTCCWKRPPSRPSCSTLMTKRQPACS